MTTAFVLIFGGTYMCWIGWMIYKGHRADKQFEKELQTMAEERRQALRWEALTAIEQADKLDRTVETLRKKRHGHRRTPRHRR